jgi:hypothetical protein
METNNHKKENIMNINNELENSSLSDAEKLMQRLKIIGNRVEWKNKEENNLPFEFTDEPKNILNEAKFLIETNNNKDRILIIWHHKLLNFYQYRVIRELYIIENIICFSLPIIISKNPKFIVGAPPPIDFSIFEDSNRTDEIDPYTIQTNLPSKFILYTTTFEERLYNVIHEMKSLRYFSEPVMVRTS